MTVTNRRTTLIIAVIVAALIVGVFARGSSHQRGAAANVLRGSAESPPDSLDPGVSYMSASWQIMVNVYNGLLTYPKEDGAPGTTVVPDLATSMPTQTDGGRTWTFTMRRGVKFGPPANREVLPSDIAYGIKRNFDLPSPGLGFYMNIVGAQEYASGKAKKITGISVDDKARTIVFRLVQPDATFLNIMALPFSFAIPKGTPAKDMSTNGFAPATGPYMFKEYNPQRSIVLVRNPAFKSWSPYSPDGTLDRIEIEIGVSPDNSVTRILRGDLDFMQGSIPRSKLPTLLKDDKIKSQIHLNKTATTSYIFLNTEVPPFNNVKMRQAINWAIDRRAMVKLAGGVGEPSETILPPNMPGWKDHQFYPGPNIAKARELVDSSGVSPGKIDIWCRTNEPSPTLAVYLQDVMTQLGFQPTVKCVDSSSYFTLVGNRSTRAKIGFGNWGQDFPEGSNFIDVLLNGKRITDEHNNNLSWYSGADTEIAAANALLDQPARNAAWGKLDAQIVGRDAAWAPFMHGTTYALVSKRLRGYTHHDVYDMLFTQVKLKGATASGGGTSSAKTTVAGGGTSSTRATVSGGGTSGRAPQQPAPAASRSTVIPPSRGNVS